MIKTDHESLKYLLEQKITTTIQQKGMYKLMGFDYTIQYKKGRKNVAADFLSRRRREEAKCMAITTIIPTWIQEVTSSYDGDPQIQKIIAELLLD